MPFTSVSQHRQAPTMLHAILTDVQFWIPLCALGLGVGLLVWLH